MHLQLDECVGLFVIFTKKKAAKLLHEVLSMESAVMIRCHMELALERAGLGNLIRAGR